MNTVHQLITRFFFRSGQSICLLNIIFQAFITIAESCSFPSAFEYFLDFLESVSEVTLAVDNLIILFLNSDGDLFELSVFLILLRRVIQEIVVF